MLALVRRDFYLAALVGLGGLTGCAGPGMPVPAGRFEPAPQAEFRTLAGRTMPAGRQLLRLRWRSEVDQVAVSGTGAARMAPDSLRIDMAVRLGVGRATLILTGDAVQAEPAELIDQLLPDRFALWAALGVIRLPDSVAQVEHLAGGGATYWRFTDAQGRANVFQVRGDTLVGVLRTEGDRAVARLMLSRGADGAVTRARVTDLLRGAVFEVDIVARQASGAFPDEVWQLRP